MAAKQLVLSSINLKAESLKIFLGVMLLFATSQISIPLRPVPIVLTTVSVMLIGLLYQRKTALITVATYLAGGAMGLPFFQGFARGFNHLYGPTAGYLVGFLLAVLVMTYLRELFNFDSFLGALFLCTIGTIAIFIPGLLWLSMIIGFKNAVIFGLQPFILPGIIKAVLLSFGLKILRPGIFKY